MKLARVDLAMDECRSHLDGAKARGTPIEAFLVMHLLVLICSAFEEEIERMVSTRISRSADEAVQSFARSCIAKTFRSLKVTEISGFLGQFGLVCKEEFQRRINGTPAETYFGTIVSNRHQVAHSTGPNVTFDDLTESYEKAHVVLDAIHAALESC
jgi:hypothetical protein